MYGFTKHPPMLEKLLNQSETFSIFSQFSDANSQPEKMLVRTAPITPLENYFNLTE